MLFSFFSKKWSYCVPSKYKVSSPCKVLNLLLWPLHLTKYSRISGGVHSSFWVPRKRTSNYPQNKNFTLYTLRIILMTLAKSFSHRSWKKSEIKKVHKVVHTPPWSSSFCYLGLTSSVIIEFRELKQSDELSLFNVFRCNISIILLNDEHYNGKIITLLISRE